MKFLKEFFNRFSLKSPAFFQVIQKISIIAAAVAGIPALLAQFQNDLGIKVPDFLTNMSNKLVVVAAVIMWIVAKLPVKATETFKVTTVKKLPFTEKKQEIN